MAELGIVGSKNSGKTTLIEGLLKFLNSKGYRVATVKHTSHSHQFDTEGKDSYRHRQAGAYMTVAVSEKELALFTEPDKCNIEQIQSMTTNQVDIWLVEGDRLADRPKILVTRNLSEMTDKPTNIMTTYGPERYENVQDHFDSEDYSGLGEFICRTMLMDMEI